MKSQLTSGTEFQFRSGVTPLGHASFPRYSTAPQFLVLLLLDYGINITNESI